MKTTIFFISLFLLNTFLAQGQYSLVVEIEPLRNNKGKVLLELSDDNKNVIDGFRGEIKDNSCTIAIHDLNPGNYAFKYFHDENNDEKINTNMVGIPKEGYGFSNNASGKFGPPSFNKMIFEFKQTDTLKCIPTYMLNK